MQSRITAPATRDGKSSAGVGEHSSAGMTLGQLFVHNCRRWDRQRVAVRHKRYGIWNEYTWADQYERVKDFALGLMSLGLRRGETVALLGDTQPESYWGMYAIWCAGGAVVGVHVDAMPNEVQYLVDHADAAFVLTKDQEQVDKLLYIKAELPKVRRVIWWDARGMHGYDDPWLTSFETVADSGKAYAADHPSAFDDRIAQSQEDDLAGMWYTSGTTALPKACCHTHRSLINFTDSAQRPVHSGPDDDAVAAFPGTIGECIFGSAALLHNGVRMNMVESPETYKQDMREIAPSHVTWVPGQWEDIVSAIQMNVAEADFLKRFFYEQFLKVGYRHAEFAYAGRRPSLPRRLLYLLGEFLVFRPVRDRVGLSNLKIGMNVGYTLGVQTLKLLRALGIDVRQLYGGTEQGETIAHVDGEIRPESIGVVQQGCLAKIAPDGELLVRSPALFAGYYKDPAATEKVVRDGWFHTGDAAYIDDRAHVFLFGRLSEMGELLGGAKYSPQFVEAQLRFGAHIRDAVAVGDKQRAYVTTIITLDAEAAARWAEQRHLLYTTLVDLSQKDELAELILMDIRRVNGTLPKEARIRKFVVLHKEFDADEGELTRTRKVKRKVVESRYAEMIEAMYSGRAEVTVRAQVTYQDGRTGTVTAAVKVRTVPLEE